MNFNDYQEAAAATSKFGNSYEYLGLGLVGEAGEVAEFLKKTIYHKKVEYDSRDTELEPLVYELGDVLWYLAGLAARAGFTLQEVAEMNIEKLAARHGVK